MIHEEKVNLTEKMEEIINQARKEARLEALEEALAAKVPEVCFVCSPTLGEHLLLKEGARWKEKAIQKLIDKDGRAMR